jgi:hypothetical protein
MTHSNRFVFGGVALLAGALAGALARAQQPAKAAAVDLRKAAIEAPAKAVAAKSRPAALANPKVAPGRVRWHADFAAAQAAAQKTGKPVLLFHLMGKLDDQFC